MTPVTAMFCGTKLETMWSGSEKREEVTLMIHSDSHR